MALLLTPKDRYPFEAKAPQACGSCKKMKRKCDKALPACGLCARMDRRCDYAEPPPPEPHLAPTAHDFAALQLKLLDLESRLNQGGINPGPSSGVPAVLGPLTAMDLILGPSHR
ncbi:hypothetical protein ColKHC_11544 [Colletotrichum higginsianum]|nr:hypothetical protein ColKHC_11544 [Colletotrichum higginsianum]